MRFLLSCTAMISLIGCSSSGEDQTSEAAIANAAAELERKADANVNRAIAEIEARSVEEAPEAAAAEVDGSAKK
jgi:hypothetical protein